MALLCMSQCWLPKLVITISLSLSTLGLWTAPSNSGVPHSPHSYLAKQHLIPLQQCLVPLAPCWLGWHQMVPEVMCALQGEVVWGDTSPECYSEGCLCSGMLWTPWYTVCHQKQCGTWTMTAASQVIAEEIIIGHFCKHKVNLRLLRTKWDNTKSTLQTFLKNQKVIFLIHRFTSHGRRMSYHNSLCLLVRWRFSCYPFLNLMDNIICLLERFKTA